MISKFEEMLTTAEANEEKHIVVRTDDVEDLLDYIREYEMRRAMFERIKDYCKNNKSCKYCLFEHVTGKCLAEDNHYNEPYSDEWRRGV